MNEHEEKTISYFIIKDIRRTYRTDLDIPKRRRKLLDRLNHCIDLNPSYTQWVENDADIVGILKKEGSPQQVYIISDDEELDGQTMSLDNAIRRTFGCFWGTIVSCIPGRLAYYRDEGGEMQAILRRT